MLRKTYEKICNIFPPRAREYCRIVFCSASENQIRVWRMRKNPFRSYTQLKNYQRKLRRIFLFSIGGLVLLVLGIVTGPEIFPKSVQHEIYIPNGKGDILVSNATKNQSIIVFKTLDALDDNSPLATKAFVEAFQDVELSQLVQKTTVDDYAVTHIIPVDGLEEGKLYYFRISAEDASVPSKLKTISSWGDGTDPIRAYASGDAVATCLPSNFPVGQTADPAVAVPKDHEQNAIQEKNETVLAPSSENLENTVGTDIGRDTAQTQNSALQIKSIQSESHLYSQNKVQAIVSWNTNIPATTELVMSEKSSDEKNGTVITADMSTKHGAVLTALKPSTTYYFKAKSVDANGVVAISEEHSLRTPRAQITVLQGIYNNFKALLNQVKPN